MRESTGRAIRIDHIKKIITNASEEERAIDEKIMISTLALNWHLSTRKIKEYLELLIDSSFCVRTNEGIERNTNKIKEK